jgi:hypothetical protein
VPLPDFGRAAARGFFVLGAGECAVDNEECYRWGELFASDWKTLVTGMAERAEALGLTQAEADGVLVWNEGATEHCRWIFVEDPTDIARIRAVYADDANVRSPSCFVVVKQQDSHETRGDVIFDIFCLSPASYLSHFNRVYTRPTS